MSSIEGNRSSSGSFHAGEPIRAPKLNNLGISSDYGKTTHSDGALSIQGQFGTVYMASSQTPTEGTNTDQFTVTVTFQDDVYWFQIVPGYCTVQDHEPIMMTGGGGGQVYVGDSTAANDMGKNVVYYVSQCNAYGSKLEEEGTNDLSSNSFAPNSEVDVNDKTTVIFLYRHTPGSGTPKLGVMTWKKYESYFANAGTPPPPNGFTNGIGQPNYGTPPGVKTTLYYEMEEIITPAKTYYAIGSMIEHVSWYKLGLHVQILAVFDQTTATLTQYHKGHVRLTDTAEHQFKTIEDGPVLTDRVEVISGWHSWFYASPDADFTGLKFE